MSGPDLSVLMATRNRDYILAGTLTHLARTLSDDGPDVEIVLVDNGSRDRTRDVVAHFERDLPLVPLHEPEPGKNRALNRGLAAARGDLVVFTDDDVIPCDGWLARFHRASHRWPDHDVFGGRIIPRYPPGLEPPFRDPEFLGWAYSHWEPEDREGPTNELPFGPNFAVRASALESVTLDETIGPGATGMGSETSLLMSLTDRGSRIVYVPDATVHHLVTPRQLDDRYLLRRAFRLGRGIARWSRDEHSPRIAGAPRHLWRELVTTWLVSRTSFGNAERALRAGLAHQRARGQIREYRLGTDSTG